MTIPRLAARRRAQWPAMLATRLPAPDTEGDVERVQCPTCSHWRMPDEVYDFTGLSVVQRAHLHLDTVWQCHPCFQAACYHGRLLASAITAAHGGDPVVVAALEHGERGCIAAGEHATTPVNQHLRG